MVPVEDALRDITRDVFASFGFTTEPVPAGDEPEGVTSSVQIDGTSMATVAVRMPADLATRLAAEMFDVEERPLAGDDIHDVAGEIANMIGGNLKSLLPGPSRLSLPVTGDGRMREQPVTAKPPSETSITFECEVGRFEVTVTIHGGGEAKAQ